MEKYLNCKFAGLDAYDLGAVSFCGICFEKGYRRYMFPCTISGAVCPHCDCAKCPYWAERSLNSRSIKGGERLNEKKIIGTIWIADCLRISNGVVENCNSCRYFNMSTYECEIPLSQKPKPRVS
jgi:hypothetical protein